MLLAVFALATHFTQGRAPDAIERFYMTVHSRLAPYYESVYASATEEVGDVSRETNDGDGHETEGELVVVTEQNDGGTEVSSLQRVVLEAAKRGENEGVSAEASSENDLLSLSDEEAAAGAGIIGKSLSVGSDRIYSLNETNLSPDLDSLAASAYPIERISAADDEPRVLIVHTHGTECYSDSAQGGVRSTDKGENVVRVGKELAEVLRFHGIVTIHSETMHDEKSYLTAYSSSKKEVQRLLELHPTIRYVIDLHRDALPNEGTSRVKTSTVINGEETAQVMLVVGTNAGGGNHPNYEKNLTVASHLQSALNDLYPTLARPINIRNAIFNQALSPGCLLLEVGSDANTLNEALRAVRMFGEAMARKIKE